MPYIVRRFDLETTPKLITEELVGRKVATLKPLILEENLFIPDFFVFTTRFFDTVSAKLREYKKIDYNSALDYFMSYKVPSSILDKFEYVSKLLSHFSAPKVAVRSSVSCKEYQGVSFSGVYPTFLNVKGKESVLEAVMKIFAYFYSEEALEYLRKNKISLQDVKLAVMVQKMVTPEVSGVAYGFDATTRSFDRFTIEAVYGIGDVIAEGEVNPDVYVIEKGSLNIVSKRVNPQFWMRAYLDTERPDRIELAKVWHYAQKLQDDQILQLVRLLERVQPHYDQDFTVEWAFAGGRYYILQVKGTLKTEKESSEKEKPRSSAKSKVRFPILSGTPLSRGDAVAPVVVINEERLQNLSDDELISLVRNKIVVLHRFDNRWRSVLPKTKVKGMILDIGSPRSDHAIFLNELKIPAIGATYNATRLLSEGTTIYLDANSGAVYLVR